MIDPQHFREHIIRPALQGIDMWSPAAENLLLGTAIQESGDLTYLVQLGNGPALGFYQMEPATHDDIWANYLAAHRVDMGEQVRALYPGFYPGLMVGNLWYATVMCRIHYWRRPEPLPDANDAEGMGQMWKQFYNTAEGAGTVAEFVQGFRDYVG